MMLGELSDLAQRLTADSQIALEVVERIHRRHPEWESRFGLHGRARCLEDTRFHLAFLASAVQARDPELMVDYARWCAAMLAARGIEREHLEEHLDLLGEALRLEGEAATIVEPILAAARAAVTAPSQPPMPEPAHPASLAYVAAALLGDRRRAWAVLESARSQGCSLPSIYTDVLIRAQRELGTRWSRGQITVAQEHMASAVTQSLLGQLYAEIRAPRSGRKALIAGVEEERHVLPGQIAADLLELQGWDVAFVGPHVPVDSVLASVEAERPDVVGLSVTLASHLPPTVALSQRILARFPAVTVVWGGAAMLRAQALGAELGVLVDADGSLAAFSTLEPRQLSR